VTEIVPGLHAVKLLSCTGYLIAEERLTLIDAGLPGSKAPLVRYLGKIGRDLSELDRIICTHGHPDHIGGVRELAAGGAEVLIHPDDLAGVGVSLQEVMRARTRGHLLHFITPHPGEATAIVEGDVIPVFGGLQVIHTPGHTPGSVSFYSGGVLFAGDTLFAGSIGRTDLPGGDAKQIAKSIQEKLYTRDPDTIVIPGHGPTTTLGDEAKHNPWVKA